jgi:DNA-3-methyladenine glycosylase II
MKCFSYERPHGFSLGAASEFYGGFLPGAGMAVAEAATLSLAFRLDGTFEPVAVSLEERGAKIVAEYTGTKHEATCRAQVARMLGLAVDATAWHAVGASDPVVGKLQAEFPGFFTATKSSPYDAAAWGIIAPRIQMKQAAKLKMGLAEQYGDAVTLNGRTHPVFPSPTQVLALSSFPGLSEEKISRLKGIAKAALEGKLEVARLRAMPEAEALEDLQTLAGVGPWTASHILFRGAAPVDALPLGEPRVLHGFADAYGLKNPSMQKMAEVAERWRPFRMWVCILLARHLNRAGGWNRPGLSRQRAASSKALRGAAPK